ncbi:MAG: nicotinate phosphoribosyltransferase [Candidatus Hydrothermarchaeota archaeon]|nr:nicotinate phosphoribosyltransferase [Candidatus Hydrothermarchaeota archaeon]
MGMFHVASADEIKEGRTTDIYFTRAKEVLEKKGIKKRVVAEVITSSLPKGYPWGVLSGIEEVAGLFEGSNVDVYAMPEGSIFHPWEPVVRLEGEYTLFTEHETPLLGLLCQASGIATKAARLKKAAGDKSLLSFGVRRMHPAISPMTDRAAYIGGVDGFSGVAAEKLIGKGASGTMPHALIIAVGDQVKAWRLYDEVIDKAVPRIALVDTYYDEKAEAIMAAEAVKGLYGVRLDTPGSRRGDMKRIVEEVRWELDIRGYKDVKILVSGGVDEDDIRELNKVDGFGIGTSISNAKTIDFAMDIIEMEGKPVAKRGKLGGKKEVYRCTACLNSEITYKKEITQCPKCGGKIEVLLKPLVKGGRIVAELPNVEKIRNYVLEQLQKVNLNGL